MRNMRSDHRMASGICPVAHYGGCAMGAGNGHEPGWHAWKKEGRIRYLGVTHYELPYFEALAEWVEKGDLDVVQVHYSIATRQAEERIIPAAVDRGTAVAVNMPLEKARLHKLVEGRPLPDFARKFGAETRAAFFLKWGV